MAAATRLLIMESVIPSGSEPFGGKLPGLLMLLAPGGKERTEDVYRRMLNRTGFELTQIVPSETEIGVIGMVKVE